MIKIKQVSSKDAVKLIKCYALTPVNNTWHFTFNLENFYTDIFYLKIGRYHLILPKRRLNQWSPLPIFSNLSKLKSVNLKIKGNPFWVYRLSSFNNFLETRSKHSKKPKKHFPSVETYEKTALKINAKLYIEQFDQTLFCETYNSLKRENHDSGEEILKILNQNYPNIPKEWLKISLLKNEENVYAIGLLCIDSKTASLLNLASSISNKSYGIFMCTEILKYCCEKNLTSFDAGVSGFYGVYKNKLFLDHQSANHSDALPIRFRFLLKLFQLFYKS